MAARYSSAMRPRSPNGTPRMSNSRSAWPTPIEIRSRPPESRSSVDTAFANTTGWWYGSTITLESTTRRVVAPATKAMAVMAWDQNEPMSSTISAGMTMCSGIEMESKSRSSAVRATSWKSAGPMAASHPWVVGG